MKSLMIFGLKYQTAAIPAQTTNASANHSHFPELLCSSVSSSLTRASASSIGKSVSSVLMLAGTGLLTFFSLGSISI